MIIFISDSECDGDGVLRKSLERSYIVTRDCQVPTSPSVAHWDDMLIFPVHKVDTSDIVDDRILGALISSWMLL